jgi:long-chain acyl-CoA synthetase
MDRETLIGFFEDFRGLPQRFLVYDDGFRSTAHTYGETYRAARAFARRLQDADVRKGDKILIWSENRSEWVPAYWGCLLAGAVVVPIDYRSSEDMLRRVQEKVQANVALIGDEVSGAPAAPNCWKLSEFDWAAAGEPDPVAIARDDLAEIIFTSGATSDPKGVLITHRNVLANIVPIENEVRKYRKWGKMFFPLRFLNMLPLSHMFGQAMATFIPPMLPGIAIFMRGYNPDEIVRQIRSRRISVLVSVPKILEILREHVERLFPETAAAPSPDIHWLRRWWKYRNIHRTLGWKFWAMVVGAAPLPAELEGFWTRLGYLVIQGYGLTETAPIVTLNHPFHARKGTVGAPIAGVEVKIAPDGEVLVRGENVTSGYYNASAEEQAAFEDGWLHTGDIGEFDAEGRLLIRGRKKEMIVTPEGLNVFPEDVEQVLDRVPGVRDSAVVGTDRVHAVLVLEPGADADRIVGRANEQLQDSQRIRGFSVWTSGELPRTEGTRKLKRRQIAQWVESGTPVSTAAAGRTPADVLSRYAAGRKITPQTTLDDLGLSSLERVELMMDLDIGETEFTDAKTVADLMNGAPRQKSAAQPEPMEFPRWNRSRIVRLIRDASLMTWILPIGRIFAWVRAEGLENLRDLEPPVIFASNHQSHLDVPSILMALPYRWRWRIAPAMSKEFFQKHFHRERFSTRQYLTNSLNYYLSTFFFNAFPLPQREAGALGTLRYAGELTSEGWCVLIFPEGKRTRQGEIYPFQPGVGLLASRLGLPVVPVRLVGLDRILNEDWKMARPGRAQVKFGAPLRLEGEDYAGLAKKVEEAVRAL